MRLFENTTYMTLRFWVILHCLFVLFSMAGIFVVTYKRKLGFATLGLIHIAVFAFAEIFRQMMVLFQLNNLRRSYLETSDELLQQMIQSNMESVSLLGYALFGLFIVSFALGCLFFGISILSNDKFDRLLGYLMIVWGIGNLLAFVNEFLFLDFLQLFIEYFSLIYQPVIRFMLGVWLLREVGLLQRLILPREIILKKP